MSCSARPPSPPPLTAHAEIPTRDATSTMSQIQQPEGRIRSTTPQICPLVPPLPSWPAKQLRAAPPPGTSARCRNCPTAAVLWARVDFLQAPPTAEGERVEEGGQRRPTCSARLSRLGGGDAGENYKGLFFVYRNFTKRFNWMLKILWNQPAKG
jgi:hypothetical protein